MTDTPSYRGALVRLTLTSLGVPVLVIGLAGWFFMSYRLDVIHQQIGTTGAKLIEDIEGRHLSGQARSTADAIDRYLIDRISNARIWVSDPLIVRAAREGAKRHEAEGLPTLDPEALEAWAPEGKSLHAFPEAEKRLLAFIHAAPEFAEVFFTDIHGINVATSNPTSDMLQSDEGWWQTAWHRSLHIGEVEFDESAGYWSIALSLRIDEPDGGPPLGVLKAVLSLGIMQATADRAKNTLREDGNVLIANAQGRIIAETTFGHSPEELMEDEIRLDNEMLAPIFVSTASSGLIPTGDHELTAFARTSGGALYEAAAINYQGLGWIVVINESTVRMEGELPALTQIESALKEWRLMLVAILGGIVVTSVLMAAILATESGRDKGSA